MAATSGDDYSNGGYNDNEQWEEAPPPRRSAAIALTALHPDVYGPCDDTFALVDALLADQPALCQRLPALCVELGSGTGFVTASLALMLGPGGRAHFLATDLNPTAAAVTERTLQAHGVDAEVVVTDLVQGLQERLAGSVDVLIFNPPYVPTDDEDVGGPGAMAAWAGGHKGRAVIDRVLSLVDALLSPKGWFYLVTVLENNPGEVCRMMRKQGFASRIVIQRQTEEESLQVLKFWRDDEEGGGSKGSSVASTPERIITEAMRKLVCWR